MAVPALNLDPLSRLPRIVIGPEWSIKLGGSHQPGGPLVELTRVADHKKVLGQEGVVIPAVYWYWFIWNCFTHDTIYDPCGIEYITEL
jgi:hypothetical protein